MIKFYLKYTQTHIDEILLQFYIVGTNLIAYSVMYETAQIICDNRDFNNNKIFK